jgi:NTE family protein
MSAASRPASAAPAPMSVLALQGGGALGAYQAGAYQGLAAHGLAVQWVIGTSIGAVNGAIIAGNPPEHRVKRLRAFWDTVSQDAPGLPLPFGAWMQAWAGPAQMMGTLVGGIPGFFSPSTHIPWSPQAAGSPEKTSFYDLAPLEKTLGGLVDLDYLNEAKVRYSVGAVQIAGGQLRFFDNTRDTIGLQHVLASAALPPGFPAVDVDGVAYWDGGICSNSPLDVALDDDERADMLIFAVDLWDPSKTLPRNLSEVLAQEKSIRYASRSAERLADHELMQNLRRAVRLLSEHLDPASRAEPALREAASLGCGARINVVRLLLHEHEAMQDAVPQDIDFRRTTVEARWARGHEDARRACQAPAWQKPLPQHVGLAVHDLPRRNGR